MVEYTAVTTIFNDKYEVINLIKNLEHQTLKPSEIIIVDGGSDDETIDIVETYKKESSIVIRYIIGGRLNISQGFNMGIKKANTEYIAIVAVGNIYENNYFELLANKVRELSLDYAYSPFCGQDNTKFSKLYNKVFLNNNNGNRLNIASNHGVFIKKSIFEELGYFYEKFIYAGEDLEFYEKVKKYDYKGEIVDEAKVYWDTPHTLKTYTKQVCVYTIGKIQIYGLLKILQKEKNKFFYVIGFIFSSVLAITKKFRFIGIILLMIYLIFNVARTIKKDVCHILLKNFDYFLSVFYYITKCKYTLKKYRVDDINRLR